VADLIVIHPDVPDASDVVDVQAREIQVEDSAIPTEQDTTVPAPLIVEPAEPELPAVIGGISPDEVAQREAEQFAKGLAQAREEAAAALEAAVREATEAALAKGRDEGREEGLQQGKAEGLEQGLAQGLEQGKTQGFEQGKTEGLEAGKEQGMVEGEAKVRAELADEMAQQRVVFENAATELGALIADPKKFFEPLKRLAMHVAEQVVVGELQTSSKGIERLVQRCLDELDHPVHGAVVLELNPEDKELLQAQGGDFTKGMRLEAVHDMQRGSVRVFANDTVVEDLVDHRLEGLAKALLIDVDAWREKSPLAQQIVEVQQEEAEDDDVHS
jgi:flagellar biosynthesis/type III secretory pathway protein FliH